MEDAKSTDEDDHFCDASDECHFYDCPEDFFESSDDSSLPPQSAFPLSSDPFRSPVAGSLRRRRLVALQERNRKFRHDLIDIERGGDNDIERGADNVDSDVVNSEKNESLTVTTSVENREDSPPVRESDEGQQFSFLVFVAELVVKAIGFQFNMFISFITFPFSALYYCFMLAVNPFYVLRLGRDYFAGKILRTWKLVRDALSPFLSEWLQEHKSVLKFVLRFGWGIFWSVFVGSVLVSLLILAFVISGLMMRYYLVEDPFHLNEGLNFDYTKSRPVAFVPITACRTMECTENNEFHGAAGVRVIPPGYKLQTTVTLILPESDYNRYLGIFQIRVDFLSENGKSLASLSHPCMLKFRSEPIRLLSTFLKVIPLIAGYVSESQTLRLKLRGYTEAVTPTACLKVTIEQRAEFRAGAGIPEVYSAFLHIESDLPFFKWLLWHWRRTIFVWLSMIIFSVELLFALVCYGAVMIPRARTGSATRNSNSQRSHQAQT